MSKPPMVFQPLEHTGAGRSKRRPPPRPASDSLPRFDCGVEVCGRPNPDGADLLVAPLPYVLISPDHWTIRFCSWGCLGRFAAIQEVRQ